MKNLDLNTFGVSELSKSETVEISGGNPLTDLLFATFTLIVKGFETFGPAVNQENCDRAAGDDYIIWADIGHR